MEAPVSLILAQLSSLLHTPLTQYTEATPTVRETTPTAEGEKTLAVNGTMSGLPFTWQFKCTRTTDNSMVRRSVQDTVFEDYKQLQSHLIGPLIACLTELSRQKEELVGIIKRKDREIQEYKENGATVSRRALSCLYYIHDHACVLVQVIWKQLPLMTRHSIQQWSTHRSVNSHVTIM